MINTKVLTMVAIAAAAITLLAASTVATPALATSSSRHDFHKDVRSFLGCVRENGHSKISRFNFADCLTDQFNIHISKHTERHL